MESYENVFEAIMTKDRADKAKRISDLILKFQHELEEAGANLDAVKELMRTVRLSRFMAS